MSQSLELTDDAHVRWKDWPMNMNPKANKQWAALVTGYDPDSKYKWDQEFLERDERDGDLYHDFRDIAPDDVVRVDAGSHNNDQTSCFKVYGKDDGTLTVEKLTDEEAIEMVTGGDTAYRRELVSDITEALQGASTDDLEAIHEWMTDEPDGDLSDDYHPLQVSAVSPGSTQASETNSDEWPDWMDNI